MGIREARKKDMAKASNRLNSVPVILYLVALRYTDSKTLLI